MEKFQEGEWWNLEALNIPCFSLSLPGGTSTSPEWITNPNTTLHEVGVKESQHLICDLAITLGVWKCAVWERSSSCRWILPQGEGDCCAVQEHFRISRWNENLPRVLCGCLGEEDFFIKSLVLVLLWRLLSSHFWTSVNRILQTQIWSEVPIQSHHWWHHVEKFLPPRWVNRAGLCPRRRRFQPVDKICIEQLSLRIIFSLSHPSPRQAKQGLSYSSRPFGRPCPINK